MGRLLEIHRNPILLVQNPGVAGEFAKRLMVAEFQELLKQLSANPWSLRAWAFELARRWPSAGRTSILDGGVLELSAA